MRLLLLLSMLALAACSQGDAKQGKDAPKGDAAKPEVPPKPPAPGKADAKPAAGGW